MKLIIIVLLVLTAVSCSAMKNVPEPVLTTEPQPQQQATRINIFNNDGFLIGFLVFGDSLYFRGREDESALEFYNSMKPSESAKLFMDELFKVHEAKQDTVIVEAIE